VAAKQAKMFARLSRNLAITTIVYFFAGPLPNGLAALNATVIPGYINVPVGWLGFMEGTVYTCTLLLSTQFRQELASLIRRQTGGVLGAGLKAKLYFGFSSGTASVRQPAPIFLQFSFIPQVKL